MTEAAEIVPGPSGAAPRGAGWFVLNLREARWWRRPGRGHNVQLTGTDDDEVLENFAQVGLNVAVLRPGEPMCQYHWEHEQEGFLVLDGEATLVVEGEARALQRWDFVHSPPGTSHALAGAGDGPCTILAVGSRSNFEHPDKGGAFDADHELAREHGMVRSFPSSEQVPYGDWLPGD